MNNEKQENVIIKNISKNFGDVQAVKEINFEIKEGEFLTLLGPSGSGKTTILNMIVGFFRPTQGEILIGGKNITTLPPEKRDMGMTFQNYALFPHMTVADNIAFPLKMKKLSRELISTRVKDVLELVQMSEYDFRYPKQLSGGQQQRVSLARSIVSNPSLLLMDEPLGALDKKLRKQMQLEIKRLHQKLGMTVVYITHDQEEALTMSDRIAIMHQGQIEQIGKPDEIYKNPANLFVSDFIGESNVITGCVETMDNDYAEMSLNNRIVFPVKKWMDKGGEVNLVLRPERLTISTEPPENLRNILPGKIVENMYVGNISRYIVSLDGTDMIFTVEKNNSADSVQFKEKEQVFVSWRVKDTIVVKS